MRSWPDVYWRGLNISTLANYVVRQKEGEAITYYAFLYVMYDFAGPSSYERFDLHINPEDVCFQLKGGKQ